MICEILGVFANTLTDDDKYSLRNRKNLPQTIQQLSEKQKLCLIAFAAYLKSTSIFEQFGKKDSPHRLCISEVRDCECL